MNIFNLDASIALNSDDFVQGIQKAMESGGKIVESMSKASASVRQYQEKLKSISEEYSAQSAKANELAEKQQSLTDKVNKNRESVEKAAEKVASSEERYNSLSESLSQSQERYNTLSEALTRTIEEFGEESEEAQKARESLEKAGDTVYKYQQRVEKTENSMEKYKQQLEKAKSQLSQNNSALQAINAEINLNNDALTENRKAAKSAIEESNKIGVIPKLFAKASEGIKKISSGFNSAKEKASELIRKIPGVSKAIEFKNTGIARLKSDFQALGVVSQAFKEKLSPITKIIKNIASAAAKISFNAAKIGIQAFANEVKKLPSKATEALKTTGEKLKNIAKTVSTVALAAVGAASAAVVGFGKTAVDSGMNFDKSMSQVAATMGKTVDEVADLREFAKKMGSETVFSATEAADALNYMALAGYDSEKSMAMLPNVLNLASAGNMDLAMASDMITDSQSALGLSMEETNQLVDKMAKASSKSNTSVSQLGDAILTVGGTAKKLKGGTTELATVLGILADNGIKGSEGGTQLRNMLNSLISPTEDAIEMLNVMGTSLYDSEGNMRSLNDVFTDLKKGMSGLETQEEKDLVLTTIFNTRDLKGAEALISNVGDRFNELSGYINDSAGAAESMAKTQLDNLAGDVTLFKSALEGVQIAVSDQLNPTLRDFVKFATDGLSDITKAFETGDLDSAINAVGKFLADMTSKILQTIPKVIEVASSIISSFGKILAERFPSIAKGILAQLSGLARNISNEAPEMIQGFSEILENVSEWIKNNSGLLIPEVMNMIKSIATGIKDTLPDIMSSVTDIIIFIGDTLADNSDLLLDSGLQIITAIIQGITKNSNKIINNFSKILKNIADWFDKNGDTLISAGHEMLQAIFDGLSENMSNMTESITKIITFIVKIISDNLPLIINIALNILGVFAQAILNNLPLLIDSAINIILSLAQYISENIDSIVSAVIDVVLKIAEILTDPDTLTALIDAAIAILMSLAQSIIDNLPELIDRLPELVQGIVDGIVENLPKLLDAAIKINEKLAEFLTNEENADKIITAAFEIITTLVKGAGDVLYKLGELADDMMQKIADELGLGEAYEWGKDLILNFCNGIKDWYTKEGGLEDTMEDFGERIYDWLHHSTPEKGPLKDDDKWGGDFADNFINGIKSRENSLSKTIKNTADILGELSETSHINVDVGLMAKDTLNGFEMTDVSADANIPIIANSSYISQNNGIQTNSEYEKNSPIVVENLNINMEGMNFSSEYEMERFINMIAEKLQARSIWKTRGTGGVIF